MNPLLRCLTLCLLLCGAGCNRYLVATPNLLRDSDPRAVFQACPTDCQTAAAPVLYATDRNLITDGKTPTYGHGRATSLAYGVANVNLQPNPSWAELTEQSTQAKRKREYELELADVREIGRIRPHAEHIQTNGSGPQIKLATMQEITTQREQLQDLLRSRLAQTQQKDVYIFIHGFNNTFEDGVFRAAEVWHFMGRTGVPIAYTWPAGWGGIRGYAYDRESGEFTVTHLRRFIKTVAECPDVERVHLIAHSRGTDVTITALRELHLGYHAQGKSTQQELKLENLILAAPDLDEEVFMQRFVGEGLLKAANRTTIYASGSDKAIELSDLVFASRRRLGLLGIKDFNPKMKRALSKLPNVQFIECKLTGSFLSHDYVFTHPAALSDLILVLRDRRPPGREHGRPLLQPSDGAWELTDDYLSQR